jgi:hypothetical protein
MGRMPALSAVPEANSTAWAGGVGIARTMRGVMSSTISERPWVEV